MILQFLQIFLTDALTFMRSLHNPVSVGEPSPLKGDHKTRSALKGLLQYSAYLATFAVVAQVGFLHHAFVLMAHRVRL